MAGEREAGELGIGNGARGAGALLGWGSKLVCEVRLVRVECEAGEGGW